MPLLCVVMVLGAVIRIVEGAPLGPYGFDLIKGLIFPTLPYGAWSITVEFQFYLVLPLLLWMIRRSPAEPSWQLRSRLGSRPSIKSGKCGVPATGP